MKRLRKLVAPVHLWLGLLSGSLMVVVALTGCIWAFEEEIRYATQREILFVEPQVNAPRATVEQIISSLEKLEGGKVNQIRFFGNPEKAVNVYTKDKQLITLNPYNAQVISVRSTEDDVMSTILSLHRTLLLGDVGKKIIYWNTWVFIVMLVTGLVLWAPRKLNQWSKYFTIRNCGNKKVYNYKIHSVGGMYAVPLLLLMAITGLSIASHKATKDEVKSVVRPVEHPERLADAALHTVWKGEPYESIRVIPAKDSTDLFRIMIRYETNSFRKESNFGFDQYSGELLVAKRYTEQSGWDRFWKSDFEIHTGRIWGLGGKVLAFCTGLMALVLPVSGFLIWFWKRRSSKGMVRKEIGKKVPAAQVV
ncbi:PepSY-associated TM helix domain-containing protein [Telluribacter humicola]|uniref:PepSY-associated TM helix domain-containing protein n=1 Tax=Telluribacter humicola TaxID=1720261 RepID=UPI001A96703D|nr:PepSY-associated TM helix domain-containing protein [Telluribacter humicola]